MSHSSDLHRAVLGSASARVRIQTEDFDVSHELAQLHAADKGVGALCSFVGTVRERQAPSSSPGLSPGAAQPAVQRFDIRAACVIHRVGLLLPLDQIVLVAVSSAHRGSSFQACEFLMDYLKTQAPFWKKESTAQGSKWVDARVSDDQALARWGMISLPSNAF
jgi:molybdopterin synthase catalytic subunit